jgi:hypothetical protein
MDFSHISAAALPSPTVEPRVRYRRIHRDGNQRAAGSWGASAIYVVTYGWIRYRR